MKFGEIPVAIEAVQYFRHCEQEALDFVGSSAFIASGVFIIRTLEGDMTVSQGDWIIRGINGEFYPCKPDISAKTYLQEGESAV